MAAILTAFTCEPLLTGLGGGGYMLIVPGPGQEPVLLDFFVEAPGRSPRSQTRAELVPVSVSFGDAVQVFNIGPASAGTYGMPLGIAEASREFGRLPLEVLVEPAARLAREGAPLSDQQAFVVALLGELVTSTPEGAAIFAPEGRLLRAGDRVRQPGVADALETLAAEGPGPFYTGEIAALVADWIEARGGILSRADLSAYRVIRRQPVRVAYRGREVLTNPPPSAGGTLIAHALGLLEEVESPPSLRELVWAMEQTQAARSPEFLDSLDLPGETERLLNAARTRSAAAQRGPSGGPGNTTHVAVLDQNRMACSVTSSIGACSGVVVPGTGIHLNNMLGEQDLNPLGFHRHPPGRRLPSMMAPTVVMRAGSPELVLGSAGSNRIRSAILQTIIRAVDEGRAAGDAVRAPRIHFEEGIVYAEPGIEVGELDPSRYERSVFRAPNLFFGGVQAVELDAEGRFRGEGDPRRGGAAVVAEVRSS